MIALLWKYKSEATVLLLVVAVTYWWHAALGAERRAGVAEERSRVADSTLAVQRPIVARTDTLVQHDTKTVTRTIARVDTLRDSVLVHLTDTLIVKEYVARTDSALHACTDLANDCAAFRVSALATIRALEQKAAAQPVAQSKSCALSNVIFTAAGVAGTWLVVKR